MDLYEQNEVAIKFWEKVNKEREQTFYYGDKASGTKPGNIYVYEALKKGEQELAKCLAVREYLQENGQELDC